MATRLQLGIVLSEAGAWGIRSFSRRLCDALLGEGIAARVLTLESVDAADYGLFDVCWVISPFDFLSEPVGHEQSLRSDFVRRRLEAIRNIVPVMEAVLSHPPNTSSHRSCCHLLSDVGFDRVLVFGLAYRAQEWVWPEKGKVLLKGVPDGLTEFEETLVPDDLVLANPVLPWCFIGRSEPQQWQVAQVLVQQVDRGGFLYLPRSDQSELRQRCIDLPRGNFRDALAKSRYFIWCARCENCHMDAVAWRAALLAGTVPIMAVPDSVTVPMNSPLQGLISTIPDLAASLRVLERSAGFRELRRVFLNMPRLGASLRECLTRYTSVTNAASQEGD